MKYGNNAKVEESNCIWTKIEKVLKKKKYNDKDKIFYQETVGFSVIDNNI